jgi:hypothetical protein
MTSIALAGARGLQTQQALPVNPLLAALVLYVDSATGSDSNPGTQTLPFATLARAWRERQQYSELRASLRVQLIGAGPYDLPPMGFSACSGLGSFIIAGDSAAETVLATGTATGDFALNVLPTSALVANVGRDDFLRITSGNCNGAVFQINENGVASVTVANVRARTTNGAVANGDTFQIVRPGTVIRVTTATLATSVNPNSIANWQGAATGTSVQVARHWFYNVRFTTTDASQLRTFGAQIGFTMVRCENGVLLSNSQVTCGFMPRSADFGIVSAKLDLLLGAGLSVTAGLFFFQSCVLVGVFSYAGSSASILDTAVTWGGGRGGVAITYLTRSVMNTIGAGQDILLSATLNVSAGGMVRPGTTGTFRFAVTVGSCVRVQLDGFVAFGSPSPTGGTTDAAGFAVDVRSGGKCLFQNVQPNFTGGTAGNDLRTTNVTAANAALAANGTPIGNAADALLGEVLARVA